MVENKYPIRVISLGAGVQSTTMLRMAIREEIEPVQHAVFCDTQWEPRAVYEHLKLLRVEAEGAGIEFHVVSKGDLRADTLQEGNFAGIPLHTISPEGKKGMGRRQCTTHYKIGPLVKKQREIAGLVRYQKCNEHRITTLIGISWDEMHRMKDAPSPWIRNEYPLVDRGMTRIDCVEWNKERGFPKPPRSACVACPLRNNGDWREVQNDPEDWANAVDFDQRVRDLDAAKRQGNAHTQNFVHYSKIPLVEVDFRTPEEKGQGTLFGGECEGMCGV